MESELAEATKSFNLSLQRRVRSLLSCLAILPAARMASHGMSNVPLDIESAPRYGAAEERQPPWRARSIQWREVFKRQDYANLILTAFMVIAVAGRRAW